MSPSSAVTCCFRHCSGAGAASLPLSVTPPPDGDAVTLWAHEACFAAQRDDTVEYDDPRDHGRIPANARCTFCGGTLPRSGTHPYVFDVGHVTPPHRLWAHAPCLLERLAPTLAPKLQLRGRRPPEEGDG